MKPPRRDFGSAGRRRRLRNVVICIAVLCAAAGVGAVAFEVVKNMNGPREVLTPLG